MAPRRDSDDLPSDGDTDPEEQRPPPRSRRSSRRPPPAARPRGSIRRWRASDDREEDDADGTIDAAPGRSGLFHREKHPVYWRARDSLYFEPLVAVAIIVLLLVGLYAYTENWPPVYVVESQSMQHGTSDVLGIINTGDLVLAQKISTDQITPYVVGVQTGYSTYGEPGDVILYLANGQGSTPIIHRALFFLQWDAQTDTYNASDLSGLRCGDGSAAQYATPGTYNGCALTGLTGTIDLYHVGWRSTNVSLDVSSPLLGGHSGFVTMGDNNFIPQGCTTNCVSGLPDQVDGISELVEPSWVVGVARGMLPWFGAVKLLLEGNAGAVPPQSWQFLGLTVAGLILLAFGIHYALRAEGIEDERRKDEEAEEASASEDDPGEEGRGRRLLRALRPWGRGNPDEEEEAAARGSKRTHPASTTKSSGRRGRPHPKVRRSTPSRRKDDPPDDDDL
jgi:signal peptidase